MRSSLLPALAFLSLVTSSCSSGDTTGAATTGGPAADPDAIPFEVTTHVDPGGEVQLCKFITMPSDRGDLAVSRIDHAYTQGSHHFLVYRTTLAAMPKGGDAFVSCDETDWMSKVRGVAYAAQSPTGEIAMPSGVSERFTAGEVLLLQVHYVNASNTGLDARVDFAFHTVKPETAPTEAGVLFFFNPIIDVPPHGTFDAKLSCPVADDIHLVFASSHMHKRGVGFSAELEGQPAGSLYTSKSWTDPVPRVFAEGDAANLVPKGSTITYSCSFQNDAEQRFIAGPSASKDEMCMFVGAYYPKQDAATENCWEGSVSTTGTASCLDTLKCAGACTAGDTDCRATCLDSVCPNGAEPMMRLGRCVEGACADICKAKGAGSSDCTSCVGAKCLDEASACQQATCAAP